MLLLALIYVAAVCAQNVKVILAASEDSDLRDEVADKLTAAGFDVTSVNARFETPTLAELEEHDVAFVWSGFSFQDPTQFGDNLADYVDRGHPVVLGMTATADNRPGGRFESRGMNPIAATSVISGDPQSLVKVLSDLGLQRRGTRKFGTHPGV